MVHLKLSDSLKEQLEKEAEQKGLNLCAYIRMILLERINRND